MKCTSNLIHKMKVYLGAAAKRMVASYWMAVARDLCSFLATFFSVVHTEVKATMKKDETL